MAESKLTIKVDAKVTQALAGIESVNKKLESMSKTTMSVTDRFIKASNTLASASIALSTIKTVASKVASALKECADAYAIQEQAQVRLSTTLKATNNVIGMSATELYDLASSFQKVTTYGDEAIIEVEKLFVSSGKIAKDVMPKAVEATLDMASALGEDLTSSARRLAKVLADPKSNLDALKDANIQLSDAQKENIKKLQEANDLFGAQDIVLQSVQNSYGGIAKALADTDSGKLTQIGNVYGDIKEGLGKGLLDTISPALDILYEKLLQISGWVSKIVSQNEIATTYKAGGTIDFRDESDEQLNSYIKGLSAEARVSSGNKRSSLERALADMEKEMYARTFGGHYNDLSQEQKSTFDELYGQITSSRYGKMLKDYQEAGLDTSDENWWRNANSYYFDKTDAKDVATYRGAVYQIGKLFPSKSTPDSPIASVSDVLGNTETAISETDDSSVSSFIASHKSLSVLAQIAEYQKEIDTATKLLGEMANDDEQYGQLAEIRSALEKKKSELENPTKQADNPTSAVSEFIGANRGLSVSAQISEVYAQIDKVTGLMDGATDSEKEMLEEIRDSYYEQLTPLERIKNGIEDVGEETEDYKDKLKTVSDYMSTFGSAANSFLSSVSSYVDTIYSNQISAIDSLLSESKSKWDKYLSNLEDKQEMQKDSLSHLYDSGLISLEEYNSATKEMYDSKMAAEEQAASEEEKLQKKRNELAEKQFNANKANQIAQAVINGAMSITSIWAQHPEPITAGILTALASATIAAQIATISATQYTPMATGGIVTKPTYALLGEGGAKEAVLPLTETNMKRAGFGQASGEGTININISIGTSYNGEQLSKDVFNGIERAQRTGLLPNWRYA